MFNSLSVRFALLGKPGIALVTVVLCFLLASCKDDALQGSNLIPGGDYLNGTFTDTFALDTWTAREDSLQTQNMSRYALGAMQDDVFGTTAAGIYTQLRLTSFGLDFDPGVTIDSTVLSLTYDGFYGDTLSPQNVKVYRLEQPITLNTDSLIYSTRTLSLGELLGEKLNFLPKISTPYTEDTIAFDPQLRIRLNTPAGEAFAQDLLAQDPAGAFKDNPSFFNYLKGLYIASDAATPSKGMIYVNLRNGESALTVYYKEPGGTETKKLRLLMNSDALNFNRFEHNYAGTPVETALADAGHQASEVYVQSLAGVKAGFSVPHLANLGNVLINKAEIELTQLHNTPDAVFEPPARMIVVARDANGRNTVIPDQLFTTGGTPTFGGGKLSVTENGVGYTKYKFSIAAQLQLILNDKTDKTSFYVVNANSASLADRIVLGGGNRNGDPYQMKLNLVYTKIP